MEIAGYELLEQIGRGGMAAVYRGMQISLDRPVAIKILFKQFTRHAELSRRFEQESMIIARLNNPHIISVIDRGITSENTPYFVMDLVEGVDLRRLIKRKQLDFSRKIDIATQICTALSHAHRNGVVHRDVKPANVIIDEEGVARVLDFGIARFNDEHSVDNDSGHAGSIMGSKAYMSPEQRELSGQVTILSDLYSLGVLLYELFTGRRPGGNYQMPSDMDSSLPNKLDTIIAWCMEKDPGNRPTSAEEVKTQLLMLSRGTHLDSGLKQSAVKDLSTMKDRFTLLDVIQENDFGAVYLFEEKLRQTPLVIKMRRALFDGFMEAKLLTSLKHRNIINILGTSKNERVFIVVMEFAKGGSLQDRLTRPIPLWEFMPIATQACEGLAFAQQNGIQHGNLRPANILFDSRKSVKVTDFGLKEHYGESARKNWYRQDGEEKSHRSDIYALGIIFRQMLTGASPDSMDQELPRAIQPLIERMTHPNPLQRYSRFSEIGSDLGNVDRNTYVEPRLHVKAAQPASPRSGRRKIGRWLLGITAICIIAILSHAFHRSDIRWSDLTDMTADDEEQVQQQEDDSWQEFPQ